ncbi:hypothetical protein EJ05DRAFT_496215 [Pseudovirgaria hyperparasitica]|uniref:Uncharacterized protein n=1 Tax=Pseudovirgaria hyperparasitica TaxID=470096 RepID=A0A6A6WMK8_9PEZI|nr:uncharacterized protein EJ05DRAFT_496215 [Pseudovirgaria hyperparasitica]KAF2763383.1 hypothetical protein EJ05DRAFT_496215 [Pseudovirgaria hyperparasitica]
MKFAYLLLFTLSAALRDSPRETLASDVLLHPPPVLNLAGVSETSRTLVDYRQKSSQDTRTNNHHARERHYTFNITREYAAPDGVNASLLLVNGHFPGPTIRANLGDVFVVKVNNRITGPETGTAIHWHGLLQKDSIFMDGVPSVSMCPIPPGESFTYRFIADRVGSSWWHSHFSGQLVGGLFGGIIIDGPSNFDYDIDIGLVMISERYHRDYRELIDATMQARVVQSDNNLINGKMPFDCSKTNLTCSSAVKVSTFDRFRSGKIHLLRIVNSGAEPFEHFSIDGHMLTVVALDFVQVDPFVTDVVSLSPGQRVEVLVNGTGEPGDSYWMRATADRSCSTVKQPFALAAIYYEGADCSVEPSSTPTNRTLNACNTTELNKATPFEHDSPETTPSYTQHYDFTFGANATGTRLFFTNNRTFRADFNNALLEQAADPVFSLAQAPPQSVLDDFSYNTSLRIVMRNFWPRPHPMHLHGHDFSILAEGIGTWNGSVRTDNPLRRDTHQMLAAYSTNNMLNGTITPSYLVIQFRLDNPGIWPFHCHIFTHLALGMYVNIAYGKKQIEQQTVPSSVHDVCVIWREYARTHLVDQPDSGLRLF